MSKRNIAILGLLIVFALSVLGAQVATLATFTAVDDGGLAALFDIDGIMLADGGDDLLCPPAIPAPACGG